MRYGIEEITIKYTTRQKISEGIVVWNRIIPVMYKDAKRTFVSAFVITGV